MKLSCFSRHSRVGGNPEVLRGSARNWIPAYAGMTILWDNISIVLSTY